MKIHLGGAELEPKPRETEMGEGGGERKTLGERKLREGVKPPQRSCADGESKKEGLLTGKR